MTPPRRGEAANSRERRLHMRQWLSPVHQCRPSNVPSGAMRCRPVPVGLRAGLIGQLVVGYKKVALAENGSVFPLVRETTLWCVCLLVFFRQLYISLSSPALDAPAVTSRLIP